MKKLFVLLLALAMVTGAFAQTVGIYTEMYATVTDDAGDASYGNYTNLSFKFSADDMGMTITTETENTQDFLVVGAVRNFDAWYKLLDGKLTIYTGDLRQDGGVRLTGLIAGAGFSSRIANADTLSVMLMAKPIDGLVLDVVVPFMDDDFATVVEFDDRMAFGAGYTVADMVKVVASYRMANEELAIGADLLMVEGLTARLGFKNVGTADTSTVYFTAGYSPIEALSLNVEGYFQFDPSVYEFGFLAEYGMDPLAFGVEATYGNTAAGWYEQDGFALYPYARMDFSKGSIEAGFQLNADETWSIPITFIVSM